MPIIYYYNFLFKIAFNEIHIEVITMLFCITENKQYNIILQQYNSKDETTLWPLENQVSNAYMRSCVCMYI